MMPKRSNAVELIFDGGSHGNPGPSYGSYVIRGMPGGAKKPARLKFQDGTNNEAEYRTLIAGIQAVLRQAKQLNLQPSEIDLLLRGDSTLVLKQMEGAWKAKDARMRALRDQARSLLKPFARVRYQHQPRSKSVRVLGH
jgi:ribonuclease HI